MSGDTRQYSSNMSEKNSPRETAKKDGRKSNVYSLRILFMLPEITSPLLIFLGFPVNVNETAPLAQIEAEDVLGITGEDRQRLG
jgi:hypothetical protein